MRHLILAAAALALLLGAQGALAHEGGDDLSPRQRHEWKCTEHYARLVGRLAYLEAKLGLNAEQQALFDTWRKAAVEGAGKVREACMERAASLDHDRTIVERLELLQKRLATGAEALEEAQAPLAALYQALDEDQRETVEHALRFGHGHHWHHHDHDGGEEQQ
jgi:hypothetical protein